MTHLDTTDRRINAAKQEIVKIDSIIQQLVAEGKSNRTLPKAPYADARLEFGRHAAGKREQRGFAKPETFNFLDLMIAGPEGGPSSDMQRYEG
jgi:hypothetical protein